MSNPAFKQYLVMALAILICCFALFSIDKDTHSIADLFKPVNLAALAVYSLPTFIVCAVLLHLFSRKTQNRSKSVVRSLVIGVPASFTLIMTLLYWHLKG
jgi:hypothetical protein